MTRDELAASLDGREYPLRPTRDEARLAKNARLLIVYGASDDLTEFDGLFTDEGYSGGNSVHPINRSDDGHWGLAGEDERGGVPIRAEWCPDGFDGSWRISTPIPHATFRIVEDGDLYCQGTVIAESDLLAALTGGA